MNPRCRPATIIFLAMTLAAAVRIRAAEHDFLTDSEVEALRNAQDPSERIEVYLDLEQRRLERMDSQRDQPAEIQRLLSQYVSLNEEMKDWIQDQYDHHGDMRKGLRALLDRGPREVDYLKQVQSWPGAANSPYASGLRDAMDSTTDGLDGATHAFSDQQKMFGELKRERQADEKAVKERTKEEKKLNKKEEKLRKRMDRQSKSGSDEN